MRENKASGESLAQKCGTMAEQYDIHKETRYWTGPHVVFGLSFEYVKSGETILDIGIGTGLGSQPFCKAGLKVYGMDLSPKMLSVCKKKGFTEELKVHDLTRVPYPYGDASINHAVCVGVLNHFENIEPVFTEVSRILKQSGIFGFIVTDRRDGDEAAFEISHAGSCHTMYRHGTDFIKGLIAAHGFVVLRELEFYIPGHGENGKPGSLKAYIAGKD